MYTIPQEKISMIYSQMDGDLVLDNPEKHYVLRIKDLPQEDKPREKLVKYGSSHLSVGELLAIVLGVVNSLYT